MSLLPRSPARRRRLLLLAGVVVVLGVGLVYLTVALDRRRQIEELEAMSDSLARLRAGTDSCRAALVREEAEFRRFAAEVDSLRDRLGAYEALHPEGVPEAEYPAYLETFDHYNDAVPDWEARADTLRAHDAACRAVVELHNRFADSLRLRVEAWEREHGG